MVKKSKSKSKPSETTPAIHTKTEYDYLHQVALWGLLALLFLPPYFRGLFFAPEQQKALLFAVLIFWVVWLWKWLQGDYRFLSHPLDYFVLAFPAVYILATFTAVNYGLAVNEVVKVTLYFLVYWSVVQLVRQQKDAVLILQVIYISALGVALAGLATATGIIEIKDGFLGGRIYSTLQYPNALASYLTAVFVLGLYLWWRVVDKPGDEAGPGNPGILPFVYTAGNFLLLAVLFGTKSQGGVLILAAVLILFFIFLPGSNRVAMAAQTAMAGIPAHLSIGRFLGAVREEHFGAAWLWILLGLAAAVAVQLAYAYSHRVIVLSLPGARQKLLAGVLVVALLATGAAVAVKADVADNLFGEIKENSMMHRVYFIQDSVAMIQDRPLLGWGGGGWQEAYRAYQSYLYHSNQVHSYHFQVGVETGALGFLVMAGMWGAFVLASVRSRLKRDFDETQMMTWSCSIAATGFFLHALIDFDLSLSALALVLWTLFALVRRFDPFSHEAVNNQVPREARNGRVLMAGVTAGCLVLLFLTSSLALSGSYARDASAYIRQQGNLQAGIEYMNQAVSYNPFQADYHGTLAQLYAYAGEQDKSLASAEAALARSKYSSARRIDLARVYASRGDWEEAVLQADKAIEQGPYLVSNYEFAGSVYKEAGLVEIKQGHKDKAKDYFLVIAGMPEQIISTADSIEEGKKSISRRVAPTRTVLLNTGIGHYFLGNFSESEEALSEAAKDKNLKAEALLWLAVLSEKQNKSEQAEKYLAEAGELDSNAAEKYEELKQLPLVN